MPLENSPPPPEESLLRVSPGHGTMSGHQGWLELEASKAKTASMTMRISYPKGGRRYLAEDTENQNSGPRNWTPLLLGANVTEITL